MNRLEHDDDLVRGAPIEIIDVQHDPIDGQDAIRLRGGILLAQLLHQVGERLKILSDGVDDAEILLVLLPGNPLLDQLRDAVRRAAFDDVLLRAPYGLLSGVQFRLRQGERLDSASVSRFGGDDVLLTVGALARDASVELNANVVELIETLRDR